MQAEMGTIAEGTQGTLVQGDGLTQGDGSLVSHPSVSCPPVSLLSSSVSAALPPEGLFSADLHVHTTFSDGSDTPLRVAARAARRNLTHIAFTDHDTLAHVYEGLGAAAQQGLCGIIGIEISAWDVLANTKAHILGYGFPGDPSHFMARVAPIEQLCSPTRLARNEVSLWQLEQLVKAGYKIDRALVKHLTTTAGCVYKQHLMAALTTAPFQSDEYQTLYRSLFKGDGICVRDITYPDARDAVAAIVQSGGIAILAHPGEFDNYQLVSHLVEAGLTGIEKYHPRHSKRDWEKVDQLAQTYGLVRTGGSDYHGSYGAPQAPGVHRTVLPATDPFVSRITL